MDARHLRRTVGAVFVLGFAPPYGALVSSIMPSESFPTAVKQRE